MSGRQPYKEFNLPSHHLPVDSEHAKPASARDPDDINFRRLRREGALVLDQERKGLRMSKRRVEVLATTEVDDGGFVAHMTTLAGLNAAYYDLASGSEVMDKKLDLPAVVKKVDGTEQYATEEELINAALAGLVESGQLSTELYEAFLKEKEGKRQQKLGKAIGNSSLLLGMVGETDNIKGLDAFDAEAYARKHLMELLEEARTVATASVNGLPPMGAHPSMLQLADPDSHMNVFARRHAPNKTAFDLWESTMQDSLEVSQSETEV